MKILFTVLAVGALAIWAWSEDLLAAWLFVMSLAAIMGGIAYTGAIINGSPHMKLDEPSSSSQHVRRAFWLFAGGLVISGSILFIWWSSKGDIFTQALFAAGLAMWLLVVVVFGTIILHDRLVTRCHSESSSIDELFH